MSIKIDNFNINNAIFLNVNGKNIAEIAHIIKCNQSILRRNFIKAGHNIIVHKKPHHRTRNLPEHELIELFLAGRSVKSLAT